MTVLFCDDDVRTAATAAAGLQLAKTNPFDLYLLDHWLADGSGVELCRNIRAFDHNTPIVFLSGSVYDSDYQEAMSAGATAYLGKPAELLRLQQTVFSLIRQAEINSLTALTAEISAIRESISDRLADLELQSREAGVRTNFAREKLINALAGKQELSDNAYFVFTGAGGARAQFERLWPAALDEAI